MTTNTTDRALLIRMDNCKADVDLPHRPRAQLSCPLAGGIRERLLSCIGKCKSNRPFKNLHL